MRAHDLDAIAVTTHPGLIGALLVGVNSASLWPPPPASR